MLSLGIDIGGTSVKLAAIDGDEGARAVIARHRDALIAVEVDDPGIVKDIATHTTGTVVTLTATPLELASAGVTLGKTYPAPIIDHKAGRERALAAYAKVRAG